MLRLAVFFFSLLTIQLAVAQSFQQFSNDVKQQALNKGFQKKVVDEAFATVQQLRRVIHKDTHQFQKEHSFQSYHRSLISKFRVDAGKLQLKKHENLLNRIQQQYHVPKQVIVALWGLESAYGKVTGNIPEFSALMTLAYQPDRRELFIKEIFAALTMVQDKSVPIHKMRGSWAGAMGQCQFLPTTYLEFAVSYKHHGPPDIWHNEGDVFASIANYLQKLGWNSKQQILYKIQLKPDFTKTLFGLKHQKTLKQWQALGVMIGNDKKSIRAPGLYSIIKPDHSDKQVFLVSVVNFKALLHWNDSSDYALSVGLLANDLKNGEK